MDRDALRPRKRKGTPIVGPLRKFEGRTMQEAYKLLQKELGRDAVVVHTRSFRRGGLLGVGAREVFEITASLEARAPDPGPAAGVDRGSAAGAEYIARTRARRPASTDDHVGMHILEGELSEIKGMLSSLMRRSQVNAPPDVTEELLELYIHMAECGIEEDLARKLVAAVNAELSGDALSDLAILRTTLIQRLAALMPAAGGLGLREGEQTVVCLIGPTGVGKTTTLAKLAANYALREGKRVGIVTADTYRIAAVEQLRRYAELMDVPMRTVVSPADARRGIEEFSDKDLILVDTAGRSQRDEMKMNELRGYLEAIRPDETHLVLAATASESMLRSAGGAFGSLGVDRLIITKVDEAEGFGFLPQLSLKINKGLSYVTNGQRVPEDILTAESTRLAELVLRREAA